MSLFFIFLFFVDSLDTFSLVSRVSDPDPLVFARSGKKADHLLHLFFKIVCKINQLEMASVHIQAPLQNTLSKIQQ